MEITDIEIIPEKKTADVWDAVTETEVVSDKSCSAHLKTYLLNKNGNMVGKAETDFELREGVRVLVKQSVLTYSPDLGDEYTMVCELIADGTAAYKKSRALVFPA